MSTGIVRISMLHSKLIVCLQSGIDMLRIVKNIMFMQIIFVNLATWCNN